MANHPPTSFEQILAVASTLFGRVLTLIALLVFGLVMYNWLAPDVPGAVVETCRTAVQNAVARAGVADLLNTPTLRSGQRFPEPDAKPDLRERFPVRSRDRYRVGFFAYLLDEQGRKIPVTATCEFPPNLSRTLDSGGVTVAGGVR